MSAKSATVNMPSTLLEELIERTRFSPVLVFFLNMLSTRQTIVAAKRQLLDTVRDQLAEASLALKSGVKNSEPQDTSALLDSVATWVTYEERVQKVPEWPYTAEIRRNLILSTLLPLVTWLLREVVLNLLADWMP